MAIDEQELQQNTFHQQIEPLKVDLTAELESAAKSSIAIGKEALRNWGAWSLDLVEASDKYSVLVHDEAKEEDRKINESVDEGDRRVHDLVFGGDSIAKAIELAAQRNKAVRLTPAPGASSDNERIPSFEVGKSYDILGSQILDTAEPKRVFSYQEVKINANQDITTAGQVSAAGLGRYLAVAPDSVIQIVSPE